MSRAGDVDTGLGIPHGTDGRQTITLCLPLDAARVITLTEWSTIAVLSTVASTHCQCSLQFASCNAEAVQDKILSDAVNPLSAWRQRTTYKVTAFSFAAGKTAHDLRTQTHQCTLILANTALSLDPCSVSHSSMHTYCTIYKIHVPCERTFQKIRYGYHMRTFSWTADGRITYLSAHHNC